MNSDSIRDASSRAKIFDERIFTGILEIEIQFCSDSETSTEVRALLQQEPREGIHLTSEDIYIVRKEKTRITRMFNVFTMHYKQS